jgi:catechol 2,3-dioxygenase-like lactoylglutathione lyase family enzyme
MLSHVNVGASDFQRALGFYGPLMETLGLELAFEDPALSMAGWKSPGRARPLFLVAKPFDGGPHAPGNGQMVALLAPSRAAVDRAYAQALAAGGADEGPPGLRPHYHPNYYGAYFRDLDGNKLCVCRHEPE